MSPCLGSLLHSRARSLTICAIVIICLYFWVTLWDSQQVYIDFIYLKRNIHVQIHSHIQTHKHKRHWVIPSKTNLEIKTAFLVRFLILTLYSPNLFLLICFKISSQKEFNTVTDISKNIWALQVAAFLIDQPRKTFLL